MIHITLKKSSFGLYKVDSFKGIPLDTLADFLISDGAEWIDFKDENYEQDAYIVWLRDKNPSNSWIGGNSMEMIKRGDKISIDSQFRDDINDWTYAFSTTNVTLIDILTQWYDILAMQPRPEEIYLIQDGDIVQLIPKSNWGHEELLTVGLQ